MTIEAVAPDQIVVPTDAGGAWTTVRGAFRSWPVALGVGVLVVWVLVAITVPLWAWASPTETVGERLTSPNSSFLLGTDALGRDVLVRTLYGARESIPTAAVVILLTVLIGSALGAVAGYVGGFVESVIMRTSDVVLAFPPIFLAMAVAAALGPGLRNTVVALVLVWWPVYARLLRGQVMSIKNREHVEAATSVGVPRRRILRKHVLPLAITPVMINATMDFGQVLILTASLSFLGLGATPPSSEWGLMIDDGTRNFYQWWISLGPGLAILTVVMAANFLGDGLRDHFDVKARRLMAEPLLAIRDLHVSFGGTGGRTLPAVRGVDLDVEPGELVAVVGESGSGKSVTMLAVLGLLGPNARATGSVRFDGEELLGAPPAQLRRVRGRRIGTIFQDPLTSLNPAHTIGDQLAEAVLAHDPRARKRARGRAGDLLELVSIPDVNRRLRSYPHELSGGMRQRVMIAMALANDPELLIADEPTTALDVTIQAQILDVLADVQRSRQLAVVLVTHDLGVVAGLAQRVNVMYAGRIVERGDAVGVFHRQNHPYTRGLLACLPRLDRRHDLQPIGGAPPSLDQLPSGCAFHTRCALAVERCTLELPELREFPSTAAACHLAPLDPVDPLDPLDVAVG